jgi:uncharacterized protein
MKVSVVRLFTIVTAAALLFVAAFAAGASGWLTVPAVQAQTQPVTPALTMPGTITVVGSGKVRIRPDIARANIGVEVVRSSVQEASAENRETLEEVLATLEEMGIAENDIQTSGFSIFAERYGPMGPLPEDQVQYRVSNMVSVTIRELDNVGEILDAAIEAGANNIYGIEFALDETADTEDAARADAIANAEEKAAALAGLTGVELGSVVSVSEIIGAGGGYYAGSFADRGQMGGGGGAPISPGELTLTMQIQVVYAIAQ